MWDYNDTPQDKFERKFYEKIYHRGKFKNIQHPEIEMMWPLYQKFMKQLGFSHFIFFENVVNINVVRKRFNGVFWKFYIYSRLKANRLQISKVIF